MFSVTFTSWSLASNAVLVISIPLAGKREAIFFQSDKLASEVRGVQTVFLFELG